VGDTPRLSRCVFHDQTVAVAVEAQRVIRRYCEGSEGARTSREARRAAPVCHMGMWVQVVVSGGMGDGGGNGKQHDIHDASGGSCRGSYLHLGRPDDAQQHNRQGACPKGALPEGHHSDARLGGAGFPRGTDSGASGLNCNFLSAGGRAPENLCMAVFKFSFSLSRKPDKENKERCKR